jgi:hypothetical protein
MGQSIRSTLGALIVFGGLAACLFWAVQPVQGESWIWVGRIISLAIVIIAGALLIYSKMLKNKAPDLLAKVCPNYFERNGLCFAIVPEVIGGQSKISIYYQNRYEHACETVVWLAPTKVAFKDVSELPEFKVKIACEGGEFGKMFCDFGLPLHFKSEAILWNVAASTKYPGGRGKLLRLRDGLRVGTEAKISAGQELLRFIGAIAHFHSEKPARIYIKFPEQMFSFPHLGEWKQETIWKFNAANLNSQKLA